MTSVGVDVRRRGINLFNVLLADDKVFLNQWLGKEGATAFMARDPAFSSLRFWDRLGKSSVSQKISDLWGLLQAV